MQSTQSNPPLRKQREYAAALKNVKLQRLFAAPFVAQMNPHIDQITHLDISYSAHSHLLSASADGTIALSDLSTRKTVWSEKAHEGFCRAAAFKQGTLDFVSVGDDKLVKIWKNNSLVHTLVAPSPLT